MSTTNVAPDSLTRFAQNIDPARILNLAEVAPYTKSNGFKPTELPESASFGTALVDSGQRIQEFLTAVQNGLNWLSGGAMKMAQTYDQNERDVTMLMSDHSSQSGDLPRVSPNLQPPAVEPGTEGSWTAPEQPIVPQLSLDG